MHKRFITVQAGDEQFEACWDMTAWATMESLTGGNALDGFKIGASNSLDALWSAIDAAAAHKDQPAPVTRRRLGTLFTSVDDMSRAFGLVEQLITSFMPEKQPAGKAESGGSATNPSPPRDATSSQQSTSGLVSASSGS